MQTRDDLQKHLEAIDFEGSISELLSILKQTHQDQLEHFESDIHLDVLETKQLIGALHEKLEEYDEAIKAFEDALEIQKKLAGSQDPTHYHEYEKDIERIRHKKESRDKQNCLYQLSFFPHFDWNDENTLRPFENKLSEMINLINLLTTDKEHIEPVVAERCYELATYYNHAKYQPNEALPYLLMAYNTYHSLPEDHLKNNEIAWVKNHLALTYYQKYVLAKQQNLKDEMSEYYRASDTYCAQLLNHHAYQDSSQPKLLSFTHCIKGQLSYKTHNYDMAIDHYQHSLELYEKLNVIDVSYAQIKTRYARALTRQKNCSVDPAVIFNELEEFWKSQENYTENHYAAKFFLSYADCLVKIDKTLALEKYAISHNTFSKVYGDQSTIAGYVAKKISSTEAKLAREKKQHNVTASSSSASFWKKDKHIILGVAAGIGLAAALTYSLKKPNGSH